MYLPTKTDLTFNLEYDVNTVSLFASMNPEQTETYLHLEADMLLTRLVTTEGKFEFDFVKELQGFKRHLRYSFQVGTSENQWVEEVYSLLLQYANDKLQGHQFDALGSHMHYDFRRERFYISDSLMEWAISSKFLEHKLRTVLSQNSDYFAAPSWANESIEHPLYDTQAS